MYGCYVICNSFRVKLSQATDHKKGKYKQAKIGRFTRISTMNSLKYAMIKSIMNSEVLTWNYIFMLVLVF